MSLADIKDAGGLAEIVRYGTPWHGTVEKVGSVYTLHTGKLDSLGAEVTLPWTAINNATTGEDYMPRRKFRNAAGVPTATLTPEKIASEALQGREWRDYAVISGKQNKLWGRDEMALGDDWLYADATGKVWQVAIALTTSSLAGNSGTFHVAFTRYGELRTDSAIAQSYAYDIALSDIGVVGLAYAIAPLTLYIGDHTETGAKTILTLAARSPAYGDSNKLATSILELDISAPATAPTINVLRGWSAMASYTYTFNVIQDVTYYTDPGVDPPGTCGYLYEAERIEACVRTFHAAYSPAGVVEYLTFEKTQRGYTKREYKQGCVLGGSDYFDSRIGSYRTDASVKKDGTALFQWWTERASNYYDDFTVPELSTIACTTDLSYAQALSWTTDCVVVEYVAYSEPTADQYAEYKFDAMYHMDGLRNMVDGSIVLSQLYPRLALFSVAQFFDRAIFPTPCGPSYIPARPSGAKPDDTQVVVLAVCPHQIDTTVHTATLPDVLSVTHKEDETLDFALHPVAYI